MDARFDSPLSCFDPDLDAHDPDSAAVEAFAGLPADATFHVWGADWCGDCRAQLPVLATTLSAAGVRPWRVAIHRVDREKVGPVTDEYGVTRIPTVVIERADEPLARYEESAPGPIDEALAKQLSNSA